MEDLGRDSSVRRLASQLQEFLRGEVDSGAFAVVGPWGSGKTWLVEATLARVGPRRSERIAVVPFTPWMYADEAAIFEGFAVLLLRETLGKGKLRTPLARGLELLGPSVKGGGFDLSGLVKAGGKVLEVDYSPESVQRSLTRLLRDQDRRLLVVIDDLDRLDPGELLTVFKLLRLISEVPRIGYLLAFDEDTVLQLLMQTPLARGSEERARRYLEKLITRRTDVPPLSGPQMSALLQPLLQRMPARPPVAVDALDVVDGGGFWLEPLFEGRLTTVRAIERFGAALHDVPAALAGEVHFWNLVAAVFVRTFYPSVWTVVVRERRVLTGDSAMLSSFVTGGGRALRAKALQAELEVLLAGEPLARDLRDLLDWMFPALKVAAGQGGGARPEERGIGDPGFVDRYLWLDLPPGDLSETELRRLLSRRSGVDAVRVLRMIEDRPGLGFAALGRAYRDGVLEIQPLFEVLDAAFARRGRREESEQDRRLAEQAAVMTRTVLPNASAAEFALLRQTHPTVHRWPLLRHVLSRDGQLDHLPSGRASSVELVRLRGELIDQLRASLGEAEDFSWDASDVRQDWGQLRRLDAAAASAVMRERFEAGRWAAEDVVTVPMRLIQSSRVGLYPRLDRGEVASWLEEPLLEQLPEAVSTVFPHGWLADPSVVLAEAVLPAELARQVGAFVLTTGRSFGRDPSLDEDDLDE